MTIRCTYVFFRDRKPDEKHSRCAVCRRACGEVHMIDSGLRDAECFGSQRLTYCATCCPEHGSGERRVEAAEQVELFG